MNDAFVEERLAQLRNDIRSQMSARRFAHTLGVESMAARLGALYLPGQEGMLRAAALLHDMTKELPLEEQEKILFAHGAALRPDELCAPKIWHGMTAAFQIPEKYPDLAIPALLSAVRWHTTGHDLTTTAEAILYLADYI